MKKKINKNIHPFHLVDPSPWPILGSLGAFIATSGAVMWFHAYSGGGFTLTLGLIIIVLVMGFWFRDIIRENTFEGNQTLKVGQGLRTGMLLFITSEVMFFFAFFWAFFYSSVNPDIALGGVWPPRELIVFDPWKVPLLNSLILLTSGSTVTVCHNCFITGDRPLAIGSLAVTILLACIFTFLQGYEYVYAGYSLSDSVYGTTFYLATGFHGFHVFIGTCFLSVCLYRLIAYHYTREDHLGFEAAAWYWHFVDVVWLYLFLAVYWWGGN
jgi:heme/copper-type cytochrome/quinol oxidase subunit 3